jgi:hypothetical protein
MILWHSLPPAAQADAIKALDVFAADHAKRVARLPRIEVIDECRYAYAGRAADRRRKAAESGSGAFSDHCLAGAEADTAMASAQDALLRVAWASVCGLPLADDE